MGTKTLSQVIGGSHGIQLAADTDYPKDKVDGQIHTSVTGIDASAGLTTVLSLTGKFVIYSLGLSQLTANDIATVKLTIDGTVIWNVDPLTNATLEHYIGNVVTLDSAVLEPIVCETSFLFEVDTDVDTDINCFYVARPIL